MPAPTPPAPPPPFTIYLDSIRKDNPQDAIQQTGSPAPLDEQKFETNINTGNPLDSKLLWAAYNIPPYRTIVAPDDQHDPVESIVSSWVADNGPCFLWSTLPWGNAAQVTSNQVSNYLGPISPIYLAAFCAYIQAGSALSGAVSPPAYLREIAAFQILCPQLWNPINYQIWKVTGRWFYTSGLGGIYDASGTFPSPSPWSLSSDFAQIGSGTLYPGQTLVVPPPSFDPVGDSQKPPAPGSAPSPSGPGLDYPPLAYPGTDWEGWGVGSYLVIVP